MPKKKQPRNAFYFFMLDYKKRCERNGEKFENGLRDVQLEAGPEWDRMPASKRKPYEDMAKEEKARLKGDNSQKQSCLLNTFESMNNQKREEEEEKYTMTTYIENTIASLSTKKLLANYRFYLVHVNYFCISEGECYHPAEIALAEFCLADGVTDVYHTIIDPGQIPLGYRHDAMQKSDSTHKIPLDRNGGEMNFYKIFQDIKRFLEPGRNLNGGQYPPLYTMRDCVIMNTHTSAVRSVMETLSTSSSSSDDSFLNYPIYSLEKLFFELNKACCDVGQSDGYNEARVPRKEFPSVSLACIELEKDVFNFTPNIACDFHRKEDVVEYCSKSYVQRWVYLMCDYCCEELGITVIPGKHLPENADVNYRRVKEEEKKVAASKPFTFVDYANNQQASSSWVPVEQPPLRRPTMPLSANLAASLPNQFAQLNMTGQMNAPIDISEDNFPAIPLSVGRGRSTQGRGSARGKPLSFADAMRNRK